MEWIFTKCTMVKHAAWCCYVGFVHVPVYSWMVFVHNGENGIALKLTAVVVRCIESTNDRLLVHGRDTHRPEYYNMTLETKYGCLQRSPPPSEPSHGVSIGTMLIVIALSGVILYCGVGFLFQRTVYGAQGMDQIPHYEFWSSLPGLIKDGCGFVSSNCKTKQPEGYDSL
ncbi:cation-dependent mannose-6-phosphate receptor-like isoform X2 [Ptychodera flava]|uniref:cation-dependent mannose-6-phosphate receptor-like isoform X2 n=1 Tax=Ptychodera flava TaxID=63121 RepID=UPI00396A5DEA